MTPPHVLKQAIVGRLQLFPVVTRSMLGVTLNGHSAATLSNIVDELVKDGVVKEGRYLAHRRISSCLYLASEEAQLQRYLGAQK